MEHAAKTLPCIRDDASGAVREHRRPCRTGPPTGDRAVSVPVAGSLRPVPRPSPICYGRGGQGTTDSRGPRREGAHAMSEAEARIDRRDFLRGSLAAATAGAIGMPGSACGGSVGAAAASFQEEADAFLARYVPGWLPLLTAADEADWAASTDVSEAHTVAKV